jgi:flagellar hook-associated protein 3 FlgL
MISGTRYRLTMEINRQLALGREIGRAQTQISTGKKILAPSDDPVAAARVSDVARAQANEAAWKRNLDFAFALSSRADTVLKSVAAGVDRAHELMVSAANGTLSTDNRATIALELRAIAGELTALKESKDTRGDPLFPQSTAPLVPVGDGLAITVVGTRERMFESVPTASGPQDLAAIAAAAADAIEETDPTLRAAAVNVSLAAIEVSTRHVAAVRGEQGTRGNRIDNLLESLANTGLQLAEERKALESANVVEIVAKLQSRQLTLEAAQAVFARVNQNTLFDLLR